MHISTWAVILYFNLACYGTCMDNTRNYTESIMNDFGSSEVKGNRICRICMSLADTLWCITMLLTCQKMWFSSHWLFQFTLFTFLISKWVPHGQMINYTIIHCSTFFPVWVEHAVYRETIWYIDWHYKLQQCAHTALVKVVSALPLGTPVFRLVRIRQRKFILACLLTCRNSARA